MPHKVAVNARHAWALRLHAGKSALQFPEPLMAAAAPDRVCVAHVDRAVARVALPTASYALQSRPAPPCAHRMRCQPSMPHVSSRASPGGSTPPSPPTARTCRDEDPFSQCFPATTTDRYRRRDRHSAATTAHRGADARSEPCIVAPGSQTVRTAQQPGTRHRIRQRCR